MLQKGKSRCKRSIFKLFAWDPARVDSRNDPYRFCHPLDDPPQVVSEL